jgi:hypothetical protein
MPIGIGRQTHVHDVYYVKVGLASKWEGIHIQHPIPCIPILNKSISNLKYANYLPHSRSSVSALE